MHLLFVDDVVLFGVGTKDEWVVYKNILALFCEASCMEISQEKSTFLEYGLNEEEKEQLISLLPFSIKEVEQGFKYPSFQLKPNNCKKADWYCLL